MLHCSPRQRKEPLNTLFFLSPSNIFISSGIDSQSPRFYSIFRLLGFGICRTELFPSPPLLVLGTFGSRRRRRRFLSLGYGQSAARLRGERAAADHSLLAAVTSVHSQVWESLHFSPQPLTPTPTTQPELDVLMKRPVIWLSGGTPWIYHHQARQQRRDTHQAPTNTTTNTTTKTTTSGIYASKVAGEKTWRL